MGEGKQGRARKGGQGRQVGEGGEGRLRPGGAGEEGHSKESGAGQGT